MKKQLVVAIDGCDRVGKKTQSQLLRRALWDAGIDVQLIEVPWDDGLTYKLIYRMLENNTALKYPTLFQIVQGINKLLCQYIHFSDSVPVVVLDRWKLSTLIYGSATNANQFITRLFTRLLIEPDVTIVLHGDSLMTKAEDSYESDDALQQKVRDLYLTYCSFNSDTVYIDVSKKTREQIRDKIFQLVQKKVVR